MKVFFIVLSFTCAIIFEEFHKFTTDEFNCLNNIFAQEYNPIIYSKMNRNKKEPRYDEQVSFIHQKNILKFIPNTSKYGYKCYLNGKAIRDTSLVNWLSGYEPDIPNLDCYIFLYKTKSYIVIINSNSRATGIASSYYQFFIYDPNKDNSHMFITLSNKMSALGIGKKNNLLEFTQVSFSDEYFHKETKEIPLKLSTFRYISTQWKSMNVRKISCKN